MLLPPSLEEQARQDFEISGQRYRESLMAGNTEEFARAMYIDPVRRKWIALASGADTQAGFDSPEKRAEDASNIDTAIQRYRESMISGHSPQRAGTMWLEPALGGLEATSFARQEAGRQEANADLLKRREMMAEEALKSRNQAAMERYSKYLSDYLESTDERSVDEMLAAGISPDQILRAGGSHMKPETRRMLAMRVVKAGEMGDRAGERDLNKAATVARGINTLMKSPFFVDETGTNLTSGAQALVERALGGLPRQIQNAGVLDPSGAGVLTNAVPRFRVIDIKLKQAQ